MSRQDYKTEVGGQLLSGVNSKNSSSSSSSFLREAELNFLSKERELHEAHEGRCNQMKQVWFDTYHVFYVFTLSSLRPDLFIFPFLVTLYDNSHITCFFTNKLLSWEGWCSFIDDIRARPVATRGYSAIRTTESKYTQLS
jgi:hypothetical protein